LQKERGLLKAGYKFEPMGKEAPAPKSVESEKVKTARVAG